MTFRSKVAYRGLGWALAALTALGGCASMTPASPVPAASTPTPIDTLALRAHTSVLAHDSLAGRGTGSAGARGAARYITRQLRLLGLEPLEPVAANATSADPFLLPVPLIRADVSRSVIRLGDDAPVTHGSGFVVGRVGRDGLVAAEGPVVPLGSDSSVVRAGAWILLDGALGEAAMRWLRVWKDSGVAGLLIRLGTDGAVDAYRAQLGDARWQLRDGPPDPVWQPDLPVLMLGPSLARRILETGGRLRFEPHARADTVIDYNVVGVLNGSATQRREYVALTAHYDHLGTARGTGDRDSIYNGFSDNAAGVAMLLTIAQSARRQPPERALLFLFTTAEEVGLLGSLHFVRTHASLVERIHAVVNLDAGAPPAPPGRWRVAAGTRSWAGTVAARVVEGHGWTHRSDAGSPNSDHWPFVARGVPAVFLIPDGAYDGLDEAAAQQLRERWDRYHHPDDEWSRDFPFAGLARYATLARDIAYALAATEVPAP